MRACPNCGFENDDTSEICVHCDQDLPPMAAPEQAAQTAEEAEQPPEAEARSSGPTPMRRPPDQVRTQSDKASQFIGGLFVGCAPLLLFLIATFNARTDLNSAFTFLSLAVLLYLGWWVWAGIAAGRSAWHFFGLGMIAALLASPIVGGIACSAALSA